MFKFKPAREGDFRCTNCGELMTANHNAAGVCITLHPHAAYPGITAAAITMCACNGALNRFVSEAVLLERLDHVLSAEGVYAEDLAAVEAWLATLNGAQIMVLVDGEESEMEALLARAPEHTDGLFMDIYNDLVG
jgi:hypothetical protein